MAQQRQILMSLNTRYYTKFAAENPRQIRISANEIKGKTQFLMYYNTLEIVICGRWFFGAADRRWHASHHHGDLATSVVTQALKPEYITQTIYEIPPHPNNRLHPIDSGEK